MKIVIQQICYRAAMVLKENCMRHGHSKKKSGCDIRQIVLNEAAI